jgi:Tol biopolymer transport system component
MKTNCPVIRAVLLFLLISLMPESVNAQKENSYPATQSGIEVGTVENTNYLYPDKNLPGVEPLLFAPGTVSTPFAERDMAISPDHREIYWSFRSPSFYVILRMVNSGHNWSTPQVVPFSGKYADIEPCFSPDGNRLYFSSNRPLQNGDNPKDYDIWYVDRENEGWSEPHNPGLPLNTGGNEFYPSFTQDGTIYFCTKRSDAIGGEDIYSAAYRDGSFQTPMNLGDSVNTPQEEFNALVAPDGSWLIYTTTGRGTGFGGGDLWISFRKPDGSWGTPHNMGETINSPALDYSPALSPDGKFLFFSSNRSQYPAFERQPLRYQDIMKMLETPRNGNQDIYWMNSRIIEQMRER